MRARLGLALFVGVLATGILLWFATRGGREARPRTEEHAPQASASPVAPGSAELRPPAPVEASRDAQVPSASAPDDWPVRVLREGVPVAGAEVAWATALELERVEGGSDYIERVERAGHRLRTDGAGMARLPALAAGAQVVARKGEWLAHRALASEKPALPLELVLALDRTLRVRVLDRLGAPAPDVPVMAQLSSGATTHRMTLSSGADGIVEFLHVGSGSGFGAGMDPTLTSGKVALEGLLATPVEVAFLMRELTSVPLELVLPACGSVVVEVLDERGQPLAEAAREVQLALQRQDPAGTHVFGPARNLGRELEDGRARFELVGLDLEFVATLDDRPAHEPAEVRFRGPQRDGEELLATLTLGEAPAILQLRVLDPDGVPLADAKLGLDRSRRFGSATTVERDHLLTDHAGRARLPLEELGAGSSLSLRLEHTSSSGVRATAELDLSRAHAYGVSDLGDVRLVPAPPLVTGQVLDAQGAPVSSGLVMVQVGSAGAAGAEPLWNDSTSGRLGGDGRFAIEGASPAGPLRLVVRADAYLPSEPLAFVAGARDLRIVLRRGGALSGRVLLPEDMEPAAFRVVAELAPGAERETKPGPTGEFQLAGLPTGRLALSFRLAPGDVELARVAELLVRDGEGTRDPRLEPVDLRSTVHALVVRVHLPDGSPAQAGWVRSLDESARAWRAAAFLIEGGTARLLVGAWPAEIEVNVPGYRIVRLEQVRSNQDATLEAAFAVRCELPADVPLPSDASLQLTLARVDESVSLQHGLSIYRGAHEAGWWNAAVGDERNTFDERRALVLPIQESGAYEATFHVVYGPEGGARMSYDIPASADTHLLVLAESASGRSFRVAPERTQYAERLAASR